MKLLARCILTLGALCMSSILLAQQKPVANLRFKLGDTIDAVKSAMQIDYPPEPMESIQSLPPGMQDPNKGKTVYHFRTKGIWAFFGQAGKVENIRLDAPFSTPVSGVKVGDSLEKMKSVLGEPIKKPFKAFISMDAYVYALDDTAYVTYDLNEEGVQYIFIRK